MRKVIAAALVCMVVVGCGPKAPPAAPAMLKVTVVFPNALAETIDQAMLPVMREAIDGPHAPAVTCVSREGIFEAYIDGNSPIGEQELRMRLARVVGKLSVLAQAPIVQRTSEAVPTESASAPAMQLRLDRERMAALGVSEEDVLAAIPGTLAAGGGAEVASGVGDATVTAKDGKAVRVREVVTITSENKPSRIVRKLPSR